MPFEKIKDYAKTVCSQIRWKKAHPVISEEIESHLIDQRNAYIADGADEAAATDNAIIQMGDPVIIGTELDRTHRPKPQWGMLILTTALVCIGIITEIIFNVPILGTGGYRWIVELLLLQVIGLALMAGSYFMDFTLIGRHPRIIYLLLLVLMTVNIIIRQIDPFSGTFYESIMPLLLPLGFAGVVYSAKNKGYRGIVLCGLAFLLPALMMLLLRYRTDFMLFAISAFMIICIAISKRWFKVKILNGYLLILIPVAVALLLAAAYIFQHSYRWEKIQAAFNLSYDPSAEFSGSKEIKGALAGSKFIGQGVMPVGAEQEPGYNIFYMLTCLIYHFGWISVIPIIGILLFFIGKGFKLCFRQKSGLALFVSVSIMMTLTIQVFSYVLFNLGFTLFNPLFLPFVIQFDSYVYLTNLVLVGLMLSVFRTGYIVKDKNINTIKSPRFVSYDNDKLTISLNRK